jgi:GT2 family glycosyltransferase
MGMVDKRRIAKPKISICIANYNGELVLGDCLDSLSQQKGNVDFEVIIHDDASKDNSISLINERYSNNGLFDITLIESKNNVGFCISNNRMVDAAKGDYILLLNNDAALEATALQVLTEIAEAGNEKGVLSLTQVDWSSGEVVDRGCYLDPFYNPIPNKNPAKENVAMVIGACLWIPKPVWDDIGGFPTWYESLAEDMYLCCFVRSLGYKVKVVRNSYYRHRQGASFGGNKKVNNRLSTTFKRRYLSERNKIYTLLIFSPILHVLLFLPVHFLLLFTEGLFLSAVRRDKRIISEIYIKSMVYALYNYRKIFSERRRISKLRKINFFKYLSAFRPYPRKLELLLKYGVPKIK